MRLGIVLLLAVAAAAPALDVPLVVPFDPDEIEPAPVGGLIPGRDAPAGAADPVAIKVRWDEYISLLVVGDAAVQGKAVRRPAWIVTYDTTEAVVVAYRGTAYRDQAGNLHFDARKAIISGPKSDQWSPDSFAVTPDGQVQTIDDANRMNTGTVLEKTAADAGDAYRRLLQIAMSIVREVS